MTERVDRIATARKLELTHSWDAWEQSDHAAFYRKDIPSVFFNTGLHADYHRPGDDWWKIDPGSAAQIGKMAADLVRELADAPDRPVFKKKPPRPVLGVRLRNAGDGKGAVLAQIFPRYGAAQAGLKAGDVIVEFAGEPVTSAADLSKLIAAQKVGSKVRAAYVRGEERIETEIPIRGR